MISGCQERLIDKPEFAPRVRWLRQRQEQLEQQLARQHERAHEQEELRGIVDQLAAFAA
jgi:capsule polysaccharide export protein KpsE/RkpR